MKRNALVRQIAKAAKARGLRFEESRSRKHDIFDLDGLKLPIPQHKEIGEGLTDRIRKECEPKLGRRWWR